MSSGPNNGEIIVRVASDGAQATLIAPAGLPPEMVLPQTLGHLVQQAGVLLTPQVIERVAAFGADYGAGSSTLSAVIATAVAPVDGEDARLEWVDGFAPNRRAAHDAPGDLPPAKAGGCDHYAGQKYVRVKPGDVVGFVHRSSNMSDGCDVRGQVIKAKPGRPLPMRIHPSVEIDAEGRLVAKAEGVLMLTGDELLVSQILTVAGDVDFSTGRIDFAGSVEVAGGICPGFSVCAKQDLRVAGLIEGAEIACGGDLVVRSGMVGQDSGTIAVAGDARFAYLNNVRGFVGADLTVEREIIDCTIDVGGNLATNGAVIGGAVSATGALNAKVLGSRAWAPTHIVLADVPALRLRRSRAARDLAQTRRRLTDLAEQERLIRMSVTRHQPVPEHLAENLREADETRIREGALEREIREIDAAIEAPRTLDVRIGKMIYPKVTLQIGDALVTFREPITGPVAITWDAERRLVCSRASGEVQPLSDIALVERRTGGEQPGDVRKSAA